MENSLPRGVRRGPRPGRPGRPLSEPRKAVLLALSGQAEPVTIAALTGLTRLHENTLRGHLEGLVRAGLARRRRAQPAGRGRPAWLYESTGTEAAQSLDTAGLAVALARSIATHSETAAEEAIEAGIEWGRELARDRGAGPLQPDEARSRIVDLMVDLGFAPRQEEADPSQVRLTRCPLLEAAYRHQDVVCAVHLGLVRGALSEHHADPAGTRLVPFSEPGACRLVVPPLPA